jgi:hypothetical protein
MTIPSHRKPCPPSLRVLFSQQKIYGKHTYDYWLIYPNQSDPCLVKTLFQSSAIPPTSNQAVKTPARNDIALFVPSCRQKLLKGFAI